jgi:GT2 family glycosyltransferase
MADSSSEEALTLEALILCFNRQDEVERAVESCQVDGIGRILVLDNASNPPIRISASSILERSNENLGPCKGRNFLAKVSTADLVLFLDDDAVIDLDTDINGLIDEFSSNENLSIIAGLVRREDGHIAKLEFPSRKVSDITNSREVGYFVEGACIIRRSHFVDLGGYDGNFFYGHEATDFALRLAVSGKQINYDPRLSFIHRPSSLGRSLTSEKYVRQMRNRRILTWRNLPRPIAVLHVSIWLAFYTTRIWKRRPSDLLQLIKAAVLPIAEQERTINRDPLPYRKLNHLQKSGYRIYW